MTSTTFCQPSSGMSSGGRPRPSRVVDEDVDAAEVRHASASTTACTCSGSGTSQRSPSARTPSALELRRRLLAALGLARAEDEVGAELGEPVRHLPADPLAAAGDDRGLAREVEQFHHERLRDGYAASRGSRVEMSSVVTPDSRQRRAGRRSARAGRRAPSRRRARPAPPRPRRAACRRGRGPGSASPRPRSRSSRREVVVEVLAARAHAADVERVVRPQRVARRSRRRRRRRRHGGGDVEAAAAGERRREGLARALRREEDRQPAVRDLGRELDRARPEGGEVDRDLGRAAAAPSASAACRARSRPGRSRGSA